MKFDASVILSALLAPALVAGEKPYKGDMTYYYPDGVFGSCGYKNSSSQYVASLSAAVMQNPPNPNSNPLCGKYVAIRYNSIRVKAQVVDTCPSCAKGDINVSPVVFEKYAPLATGRLHNVKWRFA